MSPKIDSGAERIASRVEKAVSTARPPGGGLEDPLAKGQQKIDEGLYEEAIAIFTSVLQTAPLTIDAYRGRSEAKLLLGRFAEAYHDLYALPIATVQPDDIDDLATTILTSYKHRLTGQRATVPALTGGSFARWVYWQYRAAIPLLDDLLQIDPNNVYAHLFRGSNRLFAGRDIAGGRADLERAIQLAPQSAHVRYIVADAYTYAQPDLPRASREATAALQGGLDTPRVNAILAAALLAQGEVRGAAARIQRHIDLVTRDTAAVTSLAAGGTTTLALVPGRTYQIPLQATAGQKITVRTSSTSTQIWDSILVVLGPDGAPVIGSDDHVDYFAGLDWTAPATGTYQMRVTSFEAISKGPLAVTRS